MGSQRPLPSGHHRGQGSSTCPPSFQSLHAHNMCHPHLSSRSYTQPLASCLVSVPAWRSNPEHLSIPPELTAPHSAPNQPKPQQRRLPELSPRILGGFVSFPLLRGLVEGSVVLTPTGIFFQGSRGSVTPLVCSVMAVAVVAVVVVVVVWEELPGLAH
jgi:hypothetical protein